MDYTHFYTPDRLRRIKESQSSQDLLAVALEVLVALNKNYPGPIVQVCGPIGTGGTGSRKENLAIFKRAIERVCENGLVVFNQMPFEDDMARIYKSSIEPAGELPLLEEFYGSIFSTGFIQLLCFLPGSEGSFGATWEKKRGRELKIPMLDLADCYVVD